MFCSGAVYLALNLILRPCLCRRRISDCVCTRAMPPAKCGAGILSIGPRLERRDFASFCIHGYTDGDTSPYTFLDLLLFWSEELRVESGSLARMGERGYPFKVRPGSLQKSLVGAGLRIQYRQVAAQRDINLACAMLLLAKHILRCGVDILLITLFIS